MLPAGVVIKCVKDIHKCRVIVVRIPALDMSSESNFFLFIGFYFRISVDTVTQFTSHSSS